MSQAPPAELKAIAPFLQRGHELKAADPIISYWCMYHAAQLAMSLRPTSPESRQFLLGMLDQLEAARKSMEDNDAITDEAAGSAYVENFALKVFSGADAEDRAGKATKATAKRFLAAVNFLELLANFGAVDEEAAAKIKYARWKAADLAKAFKEGRTPTPGPAGGLDAAPPPIDIDTSIEDASEVEKQLLGFNSIKSPAGPRAMDIDALSPPSGPVDADTGRSPSYPFPVTSPAITSDPSAPAFPPPPLSEPVFGEDLPADVTTPSSFPTLPAAHGSAPPLPPPQSQQPRAPAAPASAPPHSAFPSAVLPSAPSLPPPDPPAQHVEPTPAPQSMASYDDMLDPIKVGQAQRHAKWAISALNYDDLETAKQELRKALALIGG